MMKEEIVILISNVFSLQENNNPVQNQSNKTSVFCTSTGVEGGASPPIIYSTVFHFWSPLQDSIKLQDNVGHATVSD